MIYSGNCRLGDLFTSRREKGRPGLPILSVTMNDGLVPRDELERKQESGLTPEEHLLVKPGDIAYNMMRMWQGAYGLAAKEGLVSPAYVVLEPTSRIDPEFGSFMLKSPRLKYLLWAYSYGITDDRLRLYFPDFAKIPASIPPIPVQKRIAKVLGTWGRAQSAVRALLERSRDQKRALLRQLFPRALAKRRIPNGWSLVRLDELASINPPRPQSPPDGRVSFIPMESVSEDGHVVSAEEAQYAAVSNGHPSFRDGDILLAKITPCFENGKRALVGDLVNGVGFGSTEFHVLRPRLQANAGLISHLVGSPEFRRRGESEMVGSAGQKRVSKDFVTSFRFAFPKSASHRKRLVEMLGAVDTETRLLESQLAALRTEQRALLSLLLNPTAQDLKRTTKRRQKLT